MAGQAQDLSVEGLRATCPNLCRSVDELASRWLSPAIDRLKGVDRGDDTSLRTKLINDPIWRTVELEAREVLLLDSPLLQRMRGIRQLGLAHLVFPTANNDRFEHICGVVEAADRVFNALKVNAERHQDREKQFGYRPPRLDDAERITVRLAALLHDVGHGPFSHAIEPVVHTHYSNELKAANSYLMSFLLLDSKIEIAELISILIVLSPTMGQILHHNLFKRPEGCSLPEFQLRIATLIMGARRHGHLACLSAIISGQVDADKLDYMPRDAHHSGMPISFDTDRLLHRLEIVRCTADTLPHSQTRNKEFAEHSPGQQYFDLGIAASGVGALEQMLIGRAFLYDRLYHHHKVRAADAMAQRLLYFAERERDHPFELAELYLEVGDDTMIRLLGGQVTAQGFQSGKASAQFLAQAILQRDLYVRAFAFRAAFHVGLPETDDEKARTDALADVWTPVSTELSDLDGRLEAECRIFEIAKHIAPTAEMLM